jgi:hypothetical protein
MLTHQLRGRASVWSLALAIAALTWGAPLSSFLPAGLRLSAPAHAAECSVDIGGLTKKRQSIIDGLNKLQKTSPRGQLDPASSCPRLRDLAASEKELLDYLQKNKDWCMVPDEAIMNLTKSLERSRTIAGKACAFAAQEKKNQAAGDLGGGQKLPAGPL